MAGCNAARPAGPAPTDPFLRTDRRAYVAHPIREGGRLQQYGFTVVARFTNPTADTVFLAREFPRGPHPVYSVDPVRRRDLWGSAYNFARPSVGYDHEIAVPPGATRVDTLRLGGPNGFDGRTGEGFGQLEGLVRLSYELYACRRFAACPRPYASATSDAFEVRVGD